MNGFNICSLNCRGAIKDDDYQGCLNSFFEVNHFQIAFLQETHVNNLEFKKKIDQKFNCLSYWSLGTNSSKGVAILVFNKFEYKILRFQTDFDGRVIVVDIKCEIGEIRLVSVYCPNDISERKQFLSSIDRYIHSSKSLIIGGDWNCVEIIKLDKFGGNPNNGSEGSEIIKNFKRAYNLIDSFRFQHPNKKIYTWVNDTRGIKTRIDRFYISKFLKDQIYDTTILPSTVSDHYAVNLSFKNTPYRPFEVGKGIWKMNAEILKDSNFCKEIETTWNNMMRNNEINSLEDWDNCKKVFKEIAIKHCVNKSKQFYKIIKELENSLREIECLMETDSDNDFLEQLKIEKTEIVNKINILYTDRYKGAVIRSNCINLDNNEQSNTSFLRIESKMANKNMIEGLLKANGDLTINTPETIDRCHEFYSFLLKKEEIDKNIAREFLVSLPQIPEEIKNMCENLITENESFKTVNSLKDKITPGSDGLPSEFYKHFWYLFGKVFTKIINDNFINDNNLSESQQESILKLICKDNSHKNDLTYHRPISLLNTDYKIIAKTLANRLKTALPFIIHPDQSFGIKGRSIQDNIIFLNALLGYIDKKNIPAVYLNIDQEKAF